MKKDLVVVDVDDVLINLNKSVERRIKSLGYQTVVNYLIKYNKIYSVSKFE